MWFEGGLTARFEKLIVDAELLQTERAHRQWRRLLAEHEPPAVDAAPADYVARRKAGHAVERSG